MAAEIARITGHEFVKIIFRECYQDAQRDSLSMIRNPPGREPNAYLLRLHDWFTNLSKNDQDMVALAMSDVADGAVFNFLCILDGVSAITDRNREVIKLKIAADGVERDLVTDPNEELHGIFRSMVDQDRAENQAD